MLPGWLRRGAQMEPGVRRRGTIVRNCAKNIDAFKACLCSPLQRFQQQGNHCESWSTFLDSAVRSTNNNGSQALPYFVFPSVMQRKLELALFPVFYLLWSSFRTLLRETSSQSVTKLFFTLNIAITCCPYMFGFYS